MIRTNTVTYHHIIKEFNQKRTKNKSYLNWIWQCFASWCLLVVARQCQASCVAYLDLYSSFEKPLFRPTFPENIFNLIIIAYKQKKLTITVGHFKDSRGIKEEEEERFAFCFDSNETFIFISFSFRSWYFSPTIQSEQLKQKKTKTISCCRWMHIIWIKLT